MTPFEELYMEAVDAYVNGRRKEDLPVDSNQHQLDCLLHPEKHPVICSLSDCLCESDDCEKSCLFDAIKKDEKGKVIISEKDCVGCGACIDVCKQNNLTGCRDILPVLDLLHTSKEPVYVMIAPAFTSQFGDAVGPGHLRTAFKKLGFTGMIEVALFADILTLKEALEFDRSIHTDKDFLLTSCCCPIWISMIKKVY
ncbi:MAG: [Fe-Fe] hydrogenase large subunit C-terminal domain-containing protein, partial [Eubacteriales bacterium]